MLIAASCPRECRCEGTLVDCSGAGLSEVPKFIPLSTQSLLVLYFYQNFFLVKVYEFKLIIFFVSAKKAETKKNK